MKKNYFNSFTNCKWIGLLILMLFAANGVNAQVQKINLNVENASLSKVFELIEASSDYTFVFKQDDINSFKDKLITGNFKGATIQQVLDFCFKGTLLEYTITDKTTIVIKLVRKESTGDKKNNLISGTIFDEQGNVLPGVTVQIINSTIGTTTDEAGNFNLKYSLPTSKVRLKISFIGMLTQTIEATSGQKLKIILKEMVTTVNDVVVTGYQVIGKRQLTSAVTSVKAEDVLIRGQMSIDKMLEGRIPDMAVITNSGEVGVVPKIRVRGTSTLIGNREPLWVVDGIVVNDPVKISPEELNDPDYINRVGNAIAGINPMDIERIDVLKDASATALYGVKAANGVIVVTTKKGLGGTPTVNYSADLSFTSRPRYTDRNVRLMNSRERIDFSKDLIAAGHIYDSNYSQLGYEGLLARFYNHQISAEQFAQEVSKLETMNTDWFKILTKDAVSHQHTLSVSGGNDAVRYYTSFGYGRENDVIRKNNNERYTGSVKVNMVLSDKFRADINMNGNVSKRRYNQPSINPIDYAYKTSRAIAAFDDQGEYSYYKRNNGLRTNMFNILNELDNSSNQQNTSGFTMTANLNYMVAPWLNAQGIFSYTNSQNNSEGYYGDKTFYAAQLRDSEYGVAPTKGPQSNSTMPFGGELTQRSSHNDSYTARIQLDANHTFGSDYQHNIVVNLGYELNSNRYTDNQKTERGYFKDRGMSFISGVDMTDYPEYLRWLTLNRPTLTDNRTNMIAFYASASYSYKELFTINANTRIDGSNKFGSRSNEKLLPVWSISGVYNLWGHLGISSRVIDDISLRASYGYQGNMLDGQSPQMIIKKLPMDTHFNELISSVSVYPNPDLKWEKTGSSNVGIDVSMFGGKLLVGSQFYIKRTKNAFMPKNISTVNGIASYVINSGTIRNYGYNVDLSVSPIMNDRFRWTLSTNISKVFNKMETTPDANRYELTDFLTGQALVKGQPIGTFYSYKFIGLNPEDGGPMFDDLEDRAETLFGRSKYDVYTAVLTPSGNREPTLHGSLNNTFRYKKLNVSMSLAYSLGSKIRLFRLYPAGIKFDPQMNINSDMSNRWRKPGDEFTTNIPNIVNASSASSQKYMKHWSYYNSGFPIIAENAWDMYDYSDLRVVSGNYLKCSNLSLSYDFSCERLTKMGIKTCIVSGSMTNLFTICSSKLDGQTPVQSGFTDIQLSERPSFTLGVTISF